MGVVILAVLLFAADEATDLSVKIEEYEAIAAREQSRIVAALERSRASAARRGELEAVQRAEAELEAFNDSGTLPTSIPTRSYATTMRRAALKLEGAYSAAVTAATKDGDIAVADDLQKQLIAFRRETSVLFSGKATLNVAASIDLLVNGARSQSNRQYRWFNVPQELLGKAYTVLPGGKTSPLAITVRKPGDLFIAVSQPPATDIRLLEDLGCEKTELTFNYSDPASSEMTVFRLVVRDSFVLPRSDSWTGFVVIY